MSLPVLTQLSGASSSLSIKCGAITVGSDGTSISAIKQYTTSMTLNGTFLTGGPISFTVVVTQINGWTDYQFPVITIPFASMAANGQMNITGPDLGAVINGGAFVYTINIGQALGVAYAKSGTPGITLLPHAATQWAKPTSGDLVISRFSL